MNLGCCRRHVESVQRKLAIEAKMREDEEGGARRTAEAANGSLLLTAAASRPRGQLGINMEIPDGPPRLPPPRPPPRPPPPAAAAPSADVEESTLPAAAPIRVAAWATAKSALNPQKTTDTSHYIDPTKLVACAPLHQFQLSQAHRDESKPQPSPA